MSKNTYWALVLAIVVAFGVGRWTASTAPVAAKAEQNVGFAKSVKAGRVERTDVTLQELQDLFCKGSKLTDLQRQEEFNKYRGKMVQWQGVLKRAYYADEQLCAVFGHRVKPSGLLGRRTVEITVSFPDLEKSKLLNAQRGSLVTFQGQLNEHSGSYKRPWHLTNGRVVSVESPEPKTGTISQ
ncbi:MAG TPA: hypothetical protein VMW16_12840 [Sedimentisphaerales bacterium]|nr:hypothetical protein [Sedimentisphaerales bacterium]